MINDKRQASYIEVYRAPKQLKYDHTRPGGVLQVLYCIISVTLLLFLQNGFFSTGKFQLWGQSPNLVLVFVYIISVKLKTKRAVLTGMFSGLAIDIFFGRYVGLIQPGI